MTKLAYMALAGAVVGGTLYASSGPSSVFTAGADKRTFDPVPIVAAADLGGVMHELDKMSAVEFIRGKNSRRELGYLLSESTWRVAPDTVRRDIYMAGEHVLSLTAVARPAGQDQTVVDISANLPPSALTSSEALAPGDVALLTEVIEHIARLHVASALPGVDVAAQIDDSEFREQRGLSSEDVSAFRERILRAVSEPYQGAIADAELRADRDEQAEYAAEDGGAHPGWRAEQAAETVRQQVIEAEREAQQAGVWGPE